MTHPLFSVIIPTRERHDTLFYAMKSVLDQDYSDLELIVMDNFSSPETAEVVASFHDTRVRYYRAPKRLSMTENWELGLSYATGEYVSILGDDDAFIPDSFVLCEELFKTYDFKIIAWNRNLYTWPSFIAPWLRDRLHLVLEQTPLVWDSKMILEKVYERTSSYTNLPMLYNSFVHKSIIACVKSYFGRYFLSYCPDIYSGIVNAYFSDQYLYSIRCFSLAGASHHSTGSSFVHRDLGEKITKEFSKEVKEDDFNKTHDQLITTNNLEVSIANVFLCTKDIFFPENAQFKLNIFNLLQSMADAINRSNLFYDITLQEINALASKHNISPSVLDIPNKLRGEEISTSQQGLLHIVSGLISLNINCEQAGITNVLQASKLVQAMLPSKEVFLDLCKQVIELDEAKNIQESLKLQEFNLIVFPNSNGTWEQIASELFPIFKDVITHPLSRRMTVLLCFGDTYDSQITDDLISEITLQLLFDKDLEVYEDKEPSISVMEGLSESQWTMVLPRIYGRIPLISENREFIDRIDSYCQKAGLPNMKILDNLNSLSLDDI